jgi:hypothetical protein
MGDKQSTVLAPANNPLWPLGERRFVQSGG